jgi:hypothetical protein
MEVIINKIKSVIHTHTKENLTLWGLPGSNAGLLWCSVAVFPGDSGLSAEDGSLTSCSENFGSSSQPFSCRIITLINVKWKLNF